MKLHYVNLQSCYCTQNIRETKENEMGQGEDVGSVEEMVMEGIPEGKRLLQRPKRKWKVNNAWVL